MTYQWKLIVDIAFYMYFIPKTIPSKQVETIDYKFKIIVTFIFPHYFFPYVRFI